MMRTIRTLLASALLLGGATVAATAGTMSSEMTVSAQDFDEFLPQVAYNPLHQEYLVVWHDNSGFQSRSVMGRRIDRFGHLQAEFVIAFNATRDSFQPAVAYDPVRDRYLVVFGRDCFGDGSDMDVWGRLVPWSGPSGALTEFAINTWGSHQWNPKVAYANTQQEFFVTWVNEDQSGAVPTYVSGIRLSPLDGTAMASAMLIASGAEHRHSPEIAYNHSRNEYLIVYEMLNGVQGDIMAVRLNAGGSILGGGEFAVAAWPDTEEYPTVAASPEANKYLVVWHSDTPSDARDVYGRFVNGDGSIDGGPVHFAWTPTNEQYPAVASLGDGRFFVAWEEQYSSLSGPFGVQGQGIGADHSLDPRVEVRGVYAGEDPACQDIAAVGGGGTAMVVWEQTRSPGGYQDIHGRMVYDLFGDGFESGNLSQ